MLDKNHGITMSLEYQSLREELKENKKYVFERPILTIVAIFAGAQFIDKHYLAILPVVAILLFLFNFWFTVNRLRSSTRIIAYIQTILEGDSKENWIGWETFLREQRVWLKKPLEKRKQLIKIHTQTNAIPHALFYYPPIYYFHLLAVIVAFVFSIVFVLKSATVENIVAFIASIISTIIFIVYSIKLPPRKMRGLIEEFRGMILSILEEREGNSHA